MVFEEQKTLTIINFKTHCQSYLEALKQIEDREKCETLISTDFDALITSFIKLGASLTDETNQPQFRYAMHYVLAEQFKDVAILHSNVFLEFIKVDIYKSEQQVSEEKIQIHFSESKDVILNAFGAFFESIQKNTPSTNNDERSQKKIKKILTLQKDPWEIYEEQLKLVQQQLQMLNRRKIDLAKTVSIFNVLQDVADDVSKKHDLFLDNIMQSIDYLALKAKESETFKDFLSHVEDRLDNNKFSLENNLETFSESINNHVNNLIKIEVPIDAVDGMIMMREIDFSKRIQKWFDYQILPDFTDLQGLETNLLSLYNISLVNLKNSMQLTKDDESNPNFESIVGSLGYLQNDVNEVKTKAKAIIESIQNKVNTILLVSDAFKNKPYIEVPFNSSFSIEGNSILKTIKSKWEKGLSYFNLKYEQSVNFETQTDLERSTQCIAHRMHKDESQHYDSLFLNKNFIGDLFLVPREKEDQKLQSIIAEWKRGFNKSVLVVGDRLSGRSTFLDYSSKKSFTKHIVILKPNITATIDGRKFSVTYDLKEALSYVKNNNIESTKPALIIDDIELWRDKDHSLLDNIRALINFIETESDDIFVMVSTSMIMRDHLDKRLNFSNTFSHTLDLNEASKSEIEQAILIRHGAAHREMVNKKHESISPQKVRVLASKMAKQKHYNLGDTLQSWTYNTYVQDNEKVVFKESYLEFSNFFTNPELIILKQALIFKTISEYGLKRVTSSAFDLDFKSAIRRLVNVKVLLRNVDGTLYINPVIVNSVNKIIHKEHSI